MTPASFGVGHETFIGGEDGHTETTEHRAECCGPLVDPSTGLADALEEQRRLFRVEGHDDCFVDTFTFDRDIGEPAFLLQQLPELLFEARPWDSTRCVPGSLRITHAG